MSSYVNEVMKEVSNEDPVVIILVMNKCDLDGMQMSDLHQKASEIHADKCVALSLRTGVGMDELLDL